MYYINNIENINKEDKKVWIALAPDYANIGDIAISIAQRKILEEIYPDKKIIEVPMLGYFEYKDKMIDNTFIEKINEDDIITIIGGRKYGKCIYRRRRKT